MLGATAITGIMHANVSIKWVIVMTLVLLLIGLQYRLWIAEGGLAYRAQLQREIDRQRAENERLQERNRIIALEVQELKSGHASIEERAREQMGMIRQGEIFFMVVEPTTATTAPSNNARPGAQ